MPHRGYDAFFTQPFEQPGMKCRVCGSSCTVHRVSKEPTGFAEAMAGASKVHDSYVCPNTDEPWHRDAIELKIAIENMPSPRVRALMQQDLDDILAQHPPKAEP